MGDVLLTTASGSPSLSDVLLGESGIAVENLEPHVSNLKLGCRFTRLCDRISRKEYAFDHDLPAKKLGGVSNHRSFK
jgi:hypothetical protein